MSKYVKLNVALRHSESADYDAGLSPDGFSNVLEQSSKKVVEYNGLAPTTTGITITPPASLTTIDEIIIMNTHASYDIRAVVRTVIASKTFTTNKLAFVDSNPDTITDADSTFLSALFFRAGMYAVITDATEAANSGTFLAQAVAAGTLTLAAAHALTADAADVGTPTIKSVSESVQVIPEDGGVLILSGVQAGVDITLYGVTGTSECDVVIIGS